MRLDAWKRTQRHELKRIKHSSVEMKDWLKALVMVYVKRDSTYPARR